MWAIAVPALSQVITTATPSSTGAGHSMAPALTPDGRYVAFVSHANNLVTNDNLQPFLDVFVHDLETSVTRLISVDRSGFGGGGGDSAHAMISTNGRFIVFASDAPNLVANDTNQTSDIFRFDLVSEVMSLVSASTNGIAAGMSRPPVMTPDARWIVFESAANNLVSNDSASRDLFLHDAQSGSTRLITPRVSAGPISSFHSATLSADGDRVAFVSTATNLGPVVVNQNGEVYVRDVSAETTVWASGNLVTHFGTQTYRCLNTAISADGDRVAFKAARSEGSPVHVFVHELETGVTTAIASNSWPDTLAAWSSDGRWLAFEENNSIYLRDLLNATNVLVSIGASGTGPANGISIRPVMTPDARHVAFVSSASDLFGGSELVLSTNIFRLYVRDLVAGIPRLIAVTNGTGVPTGFDIHAVVPSISANGLRVAFDTDAPDIVPGDNNQASDVFVRDLDGTPTRLGSARHADRPATAGLQSAGIAMNSISSNGLRVAFSSLDDPRVPFDTNRQHDVFVRDLSALNTVAISDVARTLAPTNEASIDPILSANGESVMYLREVRLSFYLGFRTDLMFKPAAGGVLQNVDTGFTYAPAERFYAALSPDGSTVVYPRGDHLEWKNMVAGSTGRVSQTWGNQAPAGPSRSPVFSHTGRFVAFASSSAFLISNANPFIYLGRHMYVRDMQSNEIRILSLETNGAPLPNPQIAAGVFSGNDRYVVYDGVYTTNQQPRIYRFDLDTGENLLVCTNCRNPAVSFDGQTIAFSSTWGGLANRDVAVIDLSTGQTRVVARDYAATMYPPSPFEAPLLSGDGRYVVFASVRDTVVANDTNRFSDIIVHDRVQGTTTVMSRSRLGARSAAGQSSRPVMAADGRTVIFQSFAGDIIEGDYNERRDIFVVKLGFDDSDNDGMDDDWEVAYFGNLSRDGAGDQDGDGQSDLRESLAGTDPTNGGSILRVLTVTPIAGGSTTIIWSAVAGRNYVVQYKDSLDATDWTNASGVIAADSTSMSFNHSSASAQRYYRVVAVQ
jgi:Tol biopolymer transport system component